jgi:hypothetical protein
VGTLIVRMPPPSSAADEVNDRDEEGRADDRPEDGKRAILDRDHQQLGKAEVVGDQGTDEGPDEADRDGDQESPA